jgi:hypothetical protein
LIDIRVALQRLRFRLIQGNFEIALIENDQRLARFNKLVVVDIDALNVASDASADVMHVRRGVGVIGGLKIACVQPVTERSDNDESTRDRRRE